MFVLHTRDSIEEMLAQVRRFSFSRAITFGYFFLLVRVGEVKVFLSCTQILRRTSRKNLFFSNPKINEIQYMNSEKKTRKNIVLHKTKLECKAHTVAHRSALRECGLNSLQWTSSSSSGYDDGKFWETFIGSSELLVANVLSSWRSFWL